MRIGVFGLGYVGCVTSGCLAREGHRVIGVDINKEKVKMINQGKSPIFEEGIDKIIKEVTDKEKLKATTFADEAVLNSEASLVCVGTPSHEDGSLNLDYIYHAIEEIGMALKKKNDYHVVIIRSTVLPGTISELIPKIEKFSGKKVGRDFGICSNPELLREGSALKDFYNPPYTLIGEYDKKSGDCGEEIYAFLNAPLIRTKVKAAEMIKYISNAFHGLKIAFANEVGSLCKKENIDSHKVMEIFCLDDKLNLSPYYLKPGFAFGGSCLPKDLRAINYKAKELNLETPVLNSILRSNKHQIKKAIDLITSKGKKKIGILGLSFKGGTDDLRESPMVEVVEFLLEKGCEVEIYDHNVYLAKLLGKNKEFIEKKIPHISSLLVEKIEKIFDFAELIVIGNRTDEFLRAKELLSNSQVLVDYVRMFDGTVGFRGEYEGIAW